MQYRYVTEKVNYEDYAAGRVLMSQPGTTSFPVRLASEIFQRCAAVLRENGSGGLYHLYDPCCGGGYLLTVLGFLHGADLAAIFASDIDVEAVQLARRNLSLLTPAGLDGRIAQLEDFIGRFGKDSHRAALASASRLKVQLQGTNVQIKTTCFVDDATQMDTAARSIEEIDMVITDVPYGQSIHWRASDDSGSAVKQLLGSLRSALASPAVVAIVSDKRQTVGHDAYRRIKRLSADKRQIHILQPLGDYIPA